MRVPPELLKTIAFVGYHNHQTDSFQPVGSAFFVGPDSSTVGGVSRRCFLVTARHVIQGLQGKGVDEVSIRLNLKSEDNTTTLRIPLHSWRFHFEESVDIAIAEHGIPGNSDHLLIPYSMFSSQTFLQEQEVDLGDEVFVSGLFIHHAGSIKNIPIVRVGSLASLSEEKVRTRRGLLDAYLIEARSIGGLSGSPVFLNLGETRAIGGTVRLGGVRTALLGLIHSHFDVISDDTPLEDAASGIQIQSSVNAGIAIVTPVEKIFEAIRSRFPDQSDLLASIKPADFTGYTAQRIVV